MTKLNFIVSAFAFVGMSVASIGFLPQRAQAQYGPPLAGYGNNNSGGGYGGLDPCYCRDAGSIVLGRPLLICCNQRTGTCTYSDVNMQFC